MVRVVNNVNHYQDHLEFNKATRRSRETKKQQKKTLAKTEGKQKRHIIISVTILIKVSLSNKAFTSMMATRNIRSLKIVMQSAHQ